MPEQNSFGVSDLWRCKFCGLLTDEPRSHSNATCVVRARNANHKWIIGGPVPVPDSREPGLDASRNSDVSAAHQLFPEGSYVCFRCNLFTHRPSEFIKTSCCIYHCSAASAAQTHSHNTEHEIYALFPVVIPKPEELSLFE